MFHGTSVEDDSKLCRCPAEAQSSVFATVVYVHDRLLDNQRTIAFESPSE